MISPAKIMRNIDRMSKEWTYFIIAGFGAFLANVAA
jgi:hypothetical protein